jgi:hypothetical protein
VAAGVADGAAAGTTTAAVAGALSAMPDTEYKPSTMMEFVGLTVSLMRLFSVSVYGEPAVEGQGGGGESLPQA